ncbi:hypothetical protein ACFY1U_29040 [Streptomyces sp. NPDC001351]|uniref:hypothetical protein n=1 Tax=Streptomyces sp. NPDC001351 TaxID=3364564 RepID=UPI0036752DF2
MCRTFHDLSGGPVAATHRSTSKTPHAGRALDERKGASTTTPYADGNGPLIPRPELTLPALRQAVGTVAPSRLPEFFEDLQKAFVRAGDEDSVVPIRMF